MNSKNKINKFSGGLPIPIPPPGGLAGAAAGAAGGLPDLGDAGGLPDLGDAGAPPIPGAPKLPGMPDPMGSMPDPMGGMGGMSVSANVTDPQLHDMKMQFMEVQPSTWITTSNTITESICALLNKTKAEYDQDECKLKMKDSNDGYGDNTPDVPNDNIKDNMMKNFLKPIFNNLIPKEKLVQFLIEHNDDLLNDNGDDEQEGDEESNDTSNDEENEENEETSDNTTSIAIALSIANSQTNSIETEEGDGDEEEDEEEDEDEEGDEEGDGDEEGEETEGGKQKGGDGEGGDDNDDEGGDEEGGDEGDEGGEEGGEEGDGLDETINKIIEDLKKDDDNSKEIAKKLLGKGEDGEKEEEGKKKEEEGKKKEEEGKKKEEKEEKEGGKQKGGGDDGKEEGGDDDEEVTKLIEDAKEDADKFKEDYKEQLEKMAKEQNEEEPAEEPAEAPPAESSSSPADAFIEDENGISNMSAGEMIKFSQTKIVDHISCHKDCHEKVNELISNLIRIAKEKYQADDILNELFYDHAKYGRQRVNKQLIDTHTRHLDLMQDALDSEESIKAYLSILGDLYFCYLDSEKYEDGPNPDQATQERLDKIKQPLLFEKSKKLLDTARMDGGYLKLLGISGGTEELKVRIDGENIFESWLSPFITGTTGTRKRKPKKKGGKTRRQTGGRKIKCGR